MQASKRVAGPARLPSNLPGSARASPTITRAPATGHCKLLAVIRGSTRSVQSTQQATHALSQPPSSQPISLPSPVGIGFSAGGLLFPYFIGVAAGLTAAGVLTHDTPVAGASAGSLIAACTKAGLSEEQLVDATMMLAADCRRTGTYRQLGPHLKRTLTRVLPQDMHERANFQSRDDLVDALLTSCHVPFYFDGRLLTTFRGAPHFDGGLGRCATTGRSHFLPVPPNCDCTVRVCCFPATSVRGVFGQLCIAPGAFPDIHGPWPHDMNKMLTWAFNPAPEAVLLDLVERGRADAVAWTAQHKLGTLTSA